MQTITTLQSLVLGKLRQVNEARRKPVAVARSSAKVSATAQVAAATGRSGPVR